MPTITFDNLPNAHIGSTENSFLTEVQFQANNGLGWVLCDGRSVVGSKYQGQTGNANIPDARGQFLRGKNNGSGVDPDGERALAGFQGHALGSHNHSYSSTANGQLYDNNFNYGGGGARYGYVGGKTTGSNGGAETRPKNICCNIFIKIN